MATRDRRAARTGIPGGKRSAGKPRRKAGRPSAYSPSITGQICARLANGESLRQICKSPNMPAESTVRGWVVDDVEGFSAQYERARNVGLDVMADEVIAIADGATDQCAKTARLRFDARRWYLSKLAPKRYGDRLDLNVDAKVEVKDLTDEQLDARISGIITRVAAAVSASLQESRSADGGDDAA